MNRGFLSIANWRQLLLGKIRLSEWVSDVKRVIVVDVTVSVGVQVVEDMGLERNRWLHDEGVLIKPPEPRIISN